MGFLRTVCIAALSSAIFRMVVPENKFAKQISLLIAGVFLLTGITALSGAQFDLGGEESSLWADQYNSQISASVNEELRQKICKEMSDKVYGLLEAHGIFPKEIHIVVNISGLYSIDITQVELVFAGGEQAAAKAAAEVLKGELSPKIEIVTEVKE